MKEIERIRELDELIFEEFKEYFPYILNSKFMNKFPTTVNLSNAFTVSTNFIKNSIFDCTENDDLFGVKILFTSLIEHYLRFKYVCLNWIKYKDDSISKKYLEFNEAREILDSIKSEVDKQKLFEPNFKIDDWDEFLRTFPNFKNFSKKEIEEETLKYTYKNIIKFLKQIEQNEELENSFLGSLIIEYSTLSSFVHGSIGSHNELLIFKNESKRLNEYERICGLSFQMAGSVKLFSLLMFVQTDKEEFEKNYLRIDQIMKNINEKQM